nr:unnamed protein product [Spirometra erinaceieuropaei]
MGSHRNGGQIRCYKDTLKTLLKRLQINVAKWESSLPNARHANLTYRCRISQRRRPTASNVSTTSTDVPGASRTCWTPPDQQQYPGCTKRRLRLPLPRRQTSEPVPGAPTYTRCIRLHCPRTFTHSVGLFNHMRIHESGINRSLVTPSTSYTSMPSSIHTPSPNASIINSSTTATISEIDTNTADFSCPHCPRTFTSPIGLELSCLNYEEDQLPAAPPSAPGIVCWLLHACLRTDPAKRPPAHLVADALHVWCLLRNLSRRALVTTDLNLETETITALPQQKKEGKQGFLKELLKTFTFSAEEIDSSAPWLAAELTCVRRFCLKGKTRLCRQLTELLQVCWASDWLLGPAQPPDGIRANFYARVTLQRFAFCLGLVRYAHLSKILEAAAVTPITITPTS